jgi:hypothetical protein
MTAMLKSVAFLAVCVALTLSGSQVFAKTGGPSQVHSAGVAAAPAGPSGGGSQSRTKGGCRSQHCTVMPPPGHTQPPCRGGHMGPNGVMIQCQ